MYKPILENENINFINLYHFILDIINKHIKIILFFIAIYILYFFLIKDPKYTASVSFYTDYNEISNIASLNILQNLSGQESNDLSFSVSNYLNSDKFLDAVILNRYSVNGNKKTLIDIWDIKGQASLNPFSIIRSFSLVPDLSLNEKKLLIAKQQLENKISFTEDRKTGLHVISVMTTNGPDITEQIVQKIFDGILDYSSEVTSTKARENVYFIEDRLSDIGSKLKSSEDEMLKFLENNKNINSPYLILKQNRIKRDINLYNQLFISLSDQLERAKIDKEDNTSSIFILDGPHSSPYKAGRTLFENIFILFIGLSLIFFIIKSYQNRKSLFI